MSLQGAQRTSGETSTSPSCHPTRERIRIGTLKQGFTSL